MAVKGIRYKPVFPNRIPLANQNAQGFESRVGYRGFVLCIFCLRVYFILQDFGLLIDAIETLPDDMEVKMSEEWRVHDLRFFQFNLLRL
jgi:hypothetical protein